MRCKQCKGKTKVLDSREDGIEIRRRRRCLKCSAVFFTREIYSDESVRRENKLQNRDEKKIVKPKNFLPKYIKKRTENPMGLQDIWSEVTDSSFTLRELGVDKK